MSILRIVYPSGNKKQLTVAEMESFEEDEYALASRCTFAEGDASEAWEYCRELARKHDLEVKDDRKHAFLD